MACPPTPPGELRCAEATLIPSTNTSGLLARLMDACPRIVIRESEPVVPEAWVIETPVVRPVMSSVMPRTGALARMSAPSMLATTAGCALRSWLPAVPVTTTCSSAVACGAMATSIVIAPAANVTSRVTAR